MGLKESNQTNKKILKCKDIFFYVSKYTLYATFVFTSFLEFFVFENCLLRYKVICLLEKLFVCLGVKLFVCFLEMLFVH